MKQPQEIEVWYVLPAIRRELAESLVKDCKLSQKKTAEILGITEAAVSQYLKSKRGRGVKFDGKTISRIKASARKIAKDESIVLKEMQALCAFIRKNLTLCRIHRKYGNVPKECKVCFR